MDDDTKRQLLSLRSDMLKVEKEFEEVRGRYLTTKIMYEQMSIQAEVEDKKKSLTDGRMKKYDSNFSFKNLAKRLTATQLSELLGKLEQQKGR